MYLHCFFLHFLVLFVFLTRHTVYALEMLLYSLSNTNDSLAHRCVSPKISIFISTGYIVMKSLLLLPLSSFVLYLGHQRWRQHRSFKTASHSDIFTYHLAAMGLTWIFGCFFYLDGMYTDDSDMITASTYICFVYFYGELLFHLLTCVERYLAVVHPITYRGLKTTRGVRIRNIGIGCVWLLSVGITIMYKTVPVPYSTISISCFFTLSLMMVLFCNISVLCVLLHPGPKEGGRVKDRADQSKRRAFFTITVTSGVLWLWFVGLLVGNALNQSPVSDDVNYLMKASLAWFSLPSSLVSPLLYLHKTRKLFCCRAF